MKSFPVGLMVAAALLALPTTLSAAVPVDFTQPATVEIKTVKIKAFAFAAGRTAPLKIGYRTLGTPHKGADGQIDNAVLLLHDTGGTGASFLGPQAGRLFGVGAPLDVTRTFVILPDSIGVGGSTKPSDGLGVNFPHYDYSDMVRAEQVIVRDTLGVGRLRLILGVSMGAMHGWAWATDLPDAADTIIALGAWPAPVVGGNLLWRLVARDALLANPLPAGTGARLAAGLTILATVPASGLARLVPDATAARSLIDAGSTTGADPVDLAFQLDAVRSYDPAPRLDRIKARVVALNFADDPLYPPADDPLPGISRRQPRVSEIVVPASARTSGHATLGQIDAWLPLVEPAIRAAMSR